MSTFTLPRALAGDVGKDVAAPGVGAYDSKTDTYTVKVILARSFRNKWIFGNILFRLTTSGFPLCYSFKLGCSTLHIYYVKCGREERWVFIRFCTKLFMEVVKHYL